MFGRAFKLNGVDFSSYAHKEDLGVTHNTIQGLPEAYTMDGTLHDDVIATKRTYVRKLNPITTAEKTSILTQYTNPVELTVYDDKTDADITITCKTLPVTVRETIKSGLWQISDMTFVEK